MRSKLPLGCSIGRRAPFGGRHQVQVKLQPSAKRGVCQKKSVLQSYQLLSRNNLLRMRASPSPFKPPAYRCRYCFASHLGIGHHVDAAVAFRSCASAAQHTPDRIGAAIALGSVINMGV